jgi:cell division protein FtsB
MITLTVLQILKDNWKMLSIGAVVLVTATYIEVLRIETANQHAQIAKLQNNVSVLTSNNEKLQSGIEVSNRALEITSAAAASAIDKFSAVNVTIQKQTADLKQQLAAILAAKDPATCSDSINYLISNAKGYSK